jgi:malto-oligosyltrehalose trehalohydrolase
MSLAARPAAASLQAQGLEDKKMDSGTMRVLTMRCEPAFHVSPLLETQHGPVLQEDGNVRFRFWAPAQEHVDLALEDGGRILPMARMAGGWHEVVTSEAGAGSLYRFVLRDGLRVPDPASRFQPQDVHGPSEVIDPNAYAWTVTGWRGRPWHEAIIYELHVGTFTREGSFRAVIEKLDHLKSLGVTAIELMPIADFPGRRNWGYDGVLLYAPESSYGRPEDLKALVDAAHANGLMVFLDVVYNHFGPDGNYLHAYAPGFFTSRHQTPWGDGINYDGKQSGPVRAFVIENALTWIEEFRVDGLRLDAVHAIADDSPVHLLDELADRVNGVAGERHVHLILENEENQSRPLERDAQGSPRRYTAQWNDDVHHALHVAATGESAGYYAEYKDDTAKLARALAEGFAFQGEIMAFRGGPRGEASAGLSPSAFVAFIQNHDQIGNRAFGDRIAAIAPPDALKAISAIYLLLPQLPMLFMGEEWGATQPFPFFCDFKPDLADAVREGRRKEFARFPEFVDEAARARIPDPQAESTFCSAILRWPDASQPRHAAWLDWYRRILTVRRETIVPRIPAIAGHASRHEVKAQSAILVQWHLPPDETLVLAANLSAGQVAGFPTKPSRILWQEGRCDDDVLGPWAVRWSVEPG